MQAFPPTFPFPRDASSIVPESTRASTGSNQNAAQFNAFLNFSSLTFPLYNPVNMEQNWPSQQFYNYYTPDGRASGERQTTASPVVDRSPEAHSHRRLATHPMSSSSFLPPPPPTHQSSASSSSSSTQQSGMNLPPFSQAFYHSSYHSTGSQSTPANIHSLPHGINYSSHVSMQAPPQPYQYPITSPVSINEQLGSNHRAPPPHSYNESPRIPPYSSSPGLHHLSPTSPTTHMGPPGIMPSSASTSSSSFPSVSRTPVTLPRSVKRMSDSSNGSWDDGDGRYMPGSGDLDSKDGGEQQQPWGMPQDEYKALNPRDKKQVRNRIGARRFRAKRKDYVTTLEQSIRMRDEEISSLRGQVDNQRTEINNLRSRLGMPQLPPPDPTGLGLVVPQSGGRDEWVNSSLTKLVDGDV